MKRRRKAIGRGGAATGLVGLCVWLAGAGAAHADVTKDECVEANAKAQNLRLDGKLSAAREELTICNSASCPRIVRDDCAVRLDEVQKAQPTIVFDVRDAAGRDVSGLHAQIDGHDLDAGFEGRAVAIDPGSHTVTFSADGLLPKTQTLVLKEGEKGRIERVVLDPDHPAAPAPSPPLVPSPTPSAGLGGQRIAGIVAGGAGVVGLALGAVFGVSTLSAASKQKSDCASAASCDNHGAALSDHSTASTDGLVSTVSFVAGAVLLGGGAALFFTSKGAAEPRETRGASVVVAPSVGAGAAGLVCVGTF